MQVPKKNLEFSILQPNTGQKQSLDLMRHLGSRGYLPAVTCLLPATSCARAARGGGPRIPPAGGLEEQGAGGSPVPSSMSPSLFPSDRVVCIVGVY